MFSTSWFDVVAKNVDGAASPYYSLRLQDYVTVLPVTQDHEIILVRQYRPAVEAFTIELPSGHIEDREMPVEAATRELQEETGLRAASMTALAGPLFPDTGRLGNKQWCFIAADVVPSTSVAAPDPEENVDVVVCTEAELLDHILSGRFIHALHLAVLTLAAVTGHFSLQPVAMES